MHAIRSLFVVLILSAPHMARAEAARLPIFDAHLHYAGDDRAALSPQEVLAIFDRNGITRALVSSTPNDGTEALYRAAPERIVPFLGVYRTLAEKRDWMHDPGVLARVELALRSDIYRGIGEFHIFNADRDSPVLEGIVRLAVARGLLLQVHGDAGIMDACCRSGMPCSSIMRIASWSGWIPSA